MRRGLSWVAALAFVLGAEGAVCALAVGCQSSPESEPEAPVCPVAVPLELCGTAVDWPGRCAQVWPDSTPLVVLPGATSSACYPPTPFSLFVGRMPCGVWSEVELWCAR